MKKLSGCVGIASLLAGAMIVSPGCSAKSGGGGSGFQEAPKEAGPPADVDAGTDGDLGLFEAGPSLGQIDGSDGATFSWLDSGCATATAETHKDPVYLLFIVDGSGSMMSDNKWTAESQALDAIF